jgi:hypothetical protein
MRKMSYATLQKKYGGMYVLMDKPDGKVIVASKNLGEAFTIAEKKGYDAPAVQFVPTKGLKIYEVSIQSNKN